MQAILWQSLLGGARPLNMRAYMDDWFSLVLPEKKEDGKADGQ